MINERHIKDIILRTSHERYILNHVHWIETQCLCAMKQIVLWDYYSMI